MIVYRRGPELLHSGLVDVLEDSVAGRRWVASPEDVRRWSPQIEKVIVGGLDVQDVSFLREFPNVSDVWIQTSTVRDLSGLLSLQKLKKLAIDRPTCRMEILGELVTLEDLYIDAWRPGAQSLFRLNRLQRLGVQRYPYDNLRPMTELAELRDLWLNAGRLRSLEGIPRTTEKLRITSNRQLNSLVPLRGCPHLQDLRMEGVRQLRSLEGLEPCPIRILSLIKIGALRTLEPLRRKPELEFIAIAESEVSQLDVSALYTLPCVKTVRISRRSGLDPKRVSQSSPAVEVSLSEY